VTQERDAGRLPPRPRTRSPEDKRRRILEAARGLFQEQGYGDTTTARIAEAAGVSEGTLFHHFGSKRGVLSAVAGSYGADLAQAMFGELRPGDRPDVGAIVRRVFDFVQENGNLHELLVLVEDPADWNEALHANRAVIIGALSAAFAQWARRGYIETERPAEAATLCFGLVESGLVECFVRGEGRDPEPLIAEATRLIEGGLRMDPADRGGAANRDRY